MKILEPIFIDAIEKLMKHQVQFLLIGGYAVNYYGFGRYTGDIDFWINPSDENKQKFIDFLVALGRNEDELNMIRSFDFLQPQVFSLGTPPLRIDFLTKVNLLDFNAAWQRREFLTIKDFSLPIVHYDDLIIMKFNTGRTRDKLDLEELQKIHQLKRHKDKD